MKIILFGGSFDPPHRGHKEIIKECCEGNCDKLILMPSFNSPLKNKSSITLVDHRVNMLNLLIDDLSYSIEVNTWEINQNRQSFTYLTVCYLKEKYPKSSISLVIGSDQLLQFDKWENYRFILENVHIICFCRNNNKLKLFKDMSITWKKKFNVDISSSKIRKKINSGGNLENELTPLVLKYIKENQLYGAVNDI